MSNIIDITERIEDKRDGPWAVLQDPITDEVNVVPAGLLRNIVEMEVPICEDQFSVIRSIIAEWCEMKGMV